LRWLKSKCRKMALFQQLLCNLSRHMNSFTIPLDWWFCWDYHSPCAGNPIDQPRRKGFSNKFLPLLMWFDSNRMIVGLQCRWSLMLLWSQVASYLGLNDFALLGLPGFWNGAISRTAVRHMLISVQIWLSRVCWWSQMFIAFPCFVSEIASVGDYTVSYCIESMFLGKPLLAGFDCYFCCYDYCRNIIPSIPTKTCVARIQD
jgi:hypothetical protein